MSESISAVILAALSLLYLEMLTNDESTVVLVKFDMGTYDPFAVLIKCPDISKGPFLFIEFVILIFI